MKRVKCALWAIIMMFAISACGSSSANDSTFSASGGSPVYDGADLASKQEEISKKTEEMTLTASPEHGSDGTSGREETKEKGPKEEQKEKLKVEEEVMDELILSIGDKTISVTWEDNESVDALKELAGSGMQVNMSMYGGFEQVGSLGTSLPRNDSQTTTNPGDIVLYSGNQIVMFYGSNSWAYTRLGKITGLTEKELRDTLGNGDVTVSLSVEAR